MSVDDEVVATEVHDVIVVGGGVAGLSCAWKLRDAGIDVQLFEAADAPGGHVRSEVVDGFLLERGPHTLMASADHVFTLAERVGLADALTATRAEAGDRFIVRGGRMHRAPTGPWSFLTTPMLSAGAKLALATEPLRGSRGHPDDTAETFFARRFGAEAGRVLAGAFISGVYAGDPARLSARAAFPLFWGFERDHGSMILGTIAHRRRRAAERRARGIPARAGLFSFTGGLGRLSRALADHLGPRCHLSSPVTAVRRDAGRWVVTASDGAHLARRVVIAVPPGEAARLLAPVDRDLSHLLGGIPMGPVAVVHLGFAERLPQIPEGFGFLAPRGEGVRTLGVLFPSRLFPGRTPPGGDLLAGFVGGTLDPEALALDDGALRDLVLDDLRALTGLEAAPTLVRVWRHGGAIPQLVVGHAERVEAVGARLERLPGLHLAGNYLVGVGLKDAVRSGLDRAEELVTG